MEVTWFTEDEIKGSIDAFKAKYESGDLDGVADAALFYKAMNEAVLMSKNSDDDDIAMMYEDLEIDIEEYDSLAYFIEVRGAGDKGKYVMKLAPDEQKYGTYAGDYEEFSDIKNNVWMDWVPSCQLQIMKGDPNTDAQFFSGELEVKGSLKLASKPRDWIYGFFDAIGIDVD